MPDVDVSSTAESAIVPHTKTLTAERLFRIVVVIAAAPILIVAVHNGLSGWFPTNDTALTAVYVGDVFSAHPPLVGLPTRYSAIGEVQYFYFGAVHMHLLAVPVKLFGVSWGLSLGMGLLNTAWFVTALWLIRRRVGYRLGLVACVFGASLVWSLGSQVLVDPTPVQTGALAITALCAAAWSVAARDAKGLIPLALAGNYLFLTHPKFVLAVPLITGYALVAWAWGLHRLRSAGDGIAPADKHYRRRQAGIAMILTALLWLPSLFQQFFGTEGNLSAWTRVLLHGDGSVGSHGFGDTLLVVSSTVITWPLWLRDSLLHPNFTLFGPDDPVIAWVVGAVVVIGLIVVVTRSAWRRSDTEILTGLGVGLVAWSAWIPSILMQTSDEFSPTYLLALWPSSMFIWLVLVLGMLRATRVRSFVENRKGAVTTGAVTSVVLIVAFAGAAIPTADFGAGTPQATVPIAAQVRHSILREVPPGGPVWVSSPSYPARAYLPVAILTLEQKGIEVRADPGWDTVVYRPWRGFHDDPPNATRHLRILNAADPGASDDLLVHAHSELHLTETEQQAITAELEPWAAALAPYELPRDADMSAAERLAFTQNYNAALWESEVHGQDILENPKLFIALAQLDDRTLADLIDVAEPDRRQVADWVHDRYAKLGGVWVYLDPIDPQPG